MIQKRTHEYITDVDPESVFVEIGSGFHVDSSTNYFADIAQKYGTVLHTVDINDRRRVFPHSAVIPHCDAGARWTANYSKLVGKKIAERASAAGIKDVVFDRAGRKYHGRVAALADGAREGGLNF